MDAYEATKIVYQKIQTLDPQNASKIMGFLLIQDHGEKEMIRLAFGPESLVHTVILKAKKELNLSSPNMPLTPSSTPPSPSPFCNNNPLSRQNSSSSASSRLFGGGGLNLPSPLSTNQTSSSWTNSSSFSDFQNTDDLISPGGYNNNNNGGSPSTMNSAATPFYGEVDLIDELQLQDQLSFLNDGPQKSSDLFYPATWGGGGDGLHHRRSCSVSDVCMGSDDLLNGGFGWKPCLFYARGFCKNGSGCRFVHSEGGVAAADGGAAAVGSPSKFEMMGSPNFSYSNKCMNFLLQQQQLSPDSPRALMMGDAMLKFGRNRGDFGLINGVNPGSRQIYLTFPADSTFKEEDVSNYFSNYGPVQDVRIPYQQKRMFGFVTFDYPDTVKLILAKGNPHFVCDARVLVKPYKEKGKIPEKHRRQQMERGEFNGCGSPTGLESRDPFDLQLGARMLYNSQDILWRRKLEEQADLQQAIELQNRRLIGLQLLDVKRNSHHRTLSTDAVVSSPTYSSTFYNPNVVMSSNLSSSAETKENGPIGNLTEKDVDFSAKDENCNGKDSPKKDSELHEGSDHNLPDSPFASPKAGREYATAFSNDIFGAENGNSVVSAQSTNNNLITGLDMAPFKSCYFQVPRFASGHETIGM